MDDYSLFSPDIVKIAVIGKSRCGKTTLVKAFHQRFKRSREFFSYRANVNVYPCQYVEHNQIRSVTIFEIPGNIETLALVEVLEYCRANCVVLMYAIDDRFSFEMATDHYKSAVQLWKDCYHSRPAVVLVGSKIDLRHDQQVIDRLAQLHETLVTCEEGEKIFHSNDFDSFFEFFNGLDDMIQSIEFCIGRALVAMKV